MPETTTKGSRQTVQMLDFRREFSVIRNEVLEAIAEVCDFAAVHPRTAGGAV